MPLAEITLDDFTPFVGQKFPVNLPTPEPFALELLSVERNAKVSKPGRKECFSLLFRAEPRWQCPQLSYPIVHPTHGELSLLLVPLNRDEHGTVLEAVFYFT